MKTLADLKRNANKYTWALTKNSWYETIPDFQAQPRKVATIQSSKFSLLTLKNGVESESWIDWPKAGELEIKHYGLSVYDITIKRELQSYADGSKQYHIMKYRLSPIFELFKVA